MRKQKRFSTSREFAQESKKTRKRKNNPFFSIFFSISIHHGLFLLIPYSRAKAFNLADFFCDMEVEKGDQKLPSDKGILQYAALSEVKKVITAFRRTPRRCDFIETHISDIYTALSDRTMLEGDTIESFVERILEALDNPQSEICMTDGELQGTLPGDGNEAGNSNSYQFVINKNNWKTQDWEQFKARRAEILKHPNDITHEWVNRYLNRYFWEYNKKKGYKDSARMENDFFQTIIAHDPGKLSLKEQLTIQTVRSYTNIIPVMPPNEYKKKMKNILEIANAQSIVSMEDHTIFAGPLLLISELRRCAKKFHLPMPKVYICLSGALLTQTQGKTGQSVANLIQTLANTENSKDVKLPRRALAEIRGNYKNTLTELTSVPGNLVWVAPTASTDKIKRADDGLATDIYFGDDTVPNVAGFLKILKELIEKNNISVALLGLNGSNLKNPLGINELEKTMEAGKEIEWTIGSANEKNHNRAPGNTYLSLEILSPEETIDRIDTKTIMSSIALHVKNAEGDSIGHAVDIQTLRNMGKQIQDETDHQKFFFEAKKGPASMIDFKDSRYCKAIRAVFEAGKDYQRLGPQKILLRVLKKSKRK